MAKEHRETRWTQSHDWGDGDTTDWRYGTQMKLKPTEHVGELTCKKEVHVYNNSKEWSETRSVSEICLTFLRRSDKHRLFI